MIFKEALYSKSSFGNKVPVRVRPPAPIKSNAYTAINPSKFGVYRYKSAENRKHPGNRRVTKG
jgi:hypothetical protein